MNCFESDFSNVENSELNVDYNLTLSFDLLIRTSKLTKTTHYNNYQKNLYRLIKFLKENKGLGYRRISHILFERGYRSVRTKSILKPNFIFSIYQKGKTREERLNKKYTSTIEDICCLVEKLDLK